MSAAFSYKITTENEQFTFDFSPVLGSSETISSATCVVEVKEGTDSNPSAIMSGTPTINGTKVAQRIFGGLDGVIYRLEVSITTSLTNVYTLVGDLPVIAPLKV
jgi:hypothetical protein